MRGDLLCGPCGAASRLFLTVRFAPAGAGPSFRVNEKKQKVTQGTTFLENPPSLRGYFVALRPVDFQSIVRALGRCRSLLLRTVLSRDVIVGYAANDRPGSPQGCPVASRHSARGSGGEGANLQAGPVRTSAPCRQYPFERPAGGVLQVPERLKEDCKFGGFASPQNPAAQPFPPPPRLAAEQAAPRKGFLNRRFK